MNIRFCMLFLLSYQVSFGQKLHFTQYEVSNELLRKNPTCVLRHHNQFLHIGTKEGLYNFDGIKKTKYLRKEGKNQHVTALSHDGTQLWVGYEDGAIYYQEKEQLLPWTITKGLTRSKITGIYKDKSGDQWISTYGDGIYIIANQTIHHIQAKDGLGSQDIYSIVADRKGHIYAATDSGIYRCTFNQGQKMIVKLSFHPEIDHDIITKLNYDPVKNIIYTDSYEDGMWQIQLHKNTAQKVDEIHGKIISFTQNPNILIAHNKTQIFLHQEDNTESISVDGIDADLDIIDMYLDKEGILWTLCKNNGLISADLSFVMYESDLNQTQAILKIEDKIYVGSSSGLFETGKKGTTKVVLRGENVLSLVYIPRTDQIWVGTFGHGIFIIDPITGAKTNLHEGNGLINNNVFSMIIHQNDVWISTLAGIQQISYDGVFKNSWNKKTGLATDYNYTIFSDSKSNLWVGSDGQGLVCFDHQKRIRKIGNRQTIISLAEDALGRIWYCDLDKGLGYVSKGVLVPFTEENGLSELHISGITSDDKGNILAFHHTGIDVIHVQTMEVHCIGNQIGIRKWDQNINAFFKTNAHEILLTHPHKWIVYDTRYHRHLRPQLIVKSATCGQITLHPNQENALPYDQNDFQIDYVGIWMQNPESVSYRFKLAPLDHEWRYSKDIKLIYPNLRPGNYQFHLQSSSNQHFSDQDIETFTFSIKPAFWQQWWFFTSIILGALFLLLWWINTKNKRAKVLQELQTEQIKSQLETLKSQINPHFLFNSFNTLISTIEKEPKEAVFFVEKLSDFYRSMLQYRNTDFISLKEELEIHENYKFLLYQRFRKNLHITIQVDDPDTYQIIPLSLQILTENAVKHNIVSATKPLEIEIKQEGDVLWVKNNLQPRMNVEQSTQFGLHSLSKRYHALTGKEVMVQNTDSYFCVTLPLIKT